MKRLWVAVTLLALAAGLCVGASLYQHHCIDQMLNTLDLLERAYSAEQKQSALALARQLVKDYQQAGRLLYCFIAHSDLAESQETIALLPALLQEGKQEEFQMELARLREQLRYLRDIDDPLPQNIL